MILSIGKVLLDDELSAAAGHLRDADFIDGAATAGWAARGVKHNLQLPGDSPALEAIHTLVQTALQRSEAFMGAALPKATTGTLVSQSRVGMGYGNHVDNAVMGSPALRADLAFTLFLSPEGDYEGGELVIDEPQGEQAWKLAAGDMLLYPATTLHRVQPVTRGVRNVAVGWVQSLVRDPRLREILFELDAVRRSLFGDASRTREFDLLQKSYANLLRLHAEP